MDQYLQKFGAISIHAVEDAWQYIGLRHPSIINVDDAVPNYCISFWSAYLLFGMGGTAWDLNLVSLRNVFDKEDEQIMSDLKIEKTYVKFNLDNIERTLFNMYANVDKN